MLGDLADDAAREALMLRVLADFAASVTALLCAGPAGVAAKVAPVVVVAVAGVRHDRGKTPAHWREQTGSG